MTKDRDDLGLEIIPAPPFLNTAKKVRKSYQDVIKRITGKAVHGRAGLKSIYNDMMPSKTGFSKEECTTIRALITTLLSNLHSDKHIRIRDIRWKIKLGRSSYWKTTKCTPSKKVIELKAIEGSGYDRFVITYSRRKNAKFHKSFRDDKVFGFVETCDLVCYLKDGTTNFEGMGHNPYANTCGHDGEHTNHCQEWMWGFQMMVDFLEAYALGQITEKEFKCYNGRYSNTGHGLYY